MRKLLLLSPFLLISFLSNAQRFNWLKVYQSSGFASTANQKVASNGNHVYVGGEFSGTVTFGTTILTATSPTGRNLYLAKYDTLGNLIWAIKGGSTGTNFDQMRGLDVDADGNAYVTGLFSQSCQWGSLIQNGFYISVTNAREGFVAKIKANGSADWIKTFHDPNSTFVGFNTVESVHTAGDKVIVIGELSNTLHFNGSTVIVSSPLASQSENLWIGKFDTAGTVLSADVPIYEDNTGFNSLFFHDFELINEDEFVVTGEFNGSIRFGQTVHSASTFTLFIARFSNVDSTDWVVKSTTGNINASRMGLGKNNEVIFTGTYSSNLVLGGKSISTTNFNQWYAGSISSAGTVLELKNLDMEGFGMSDLVTNQNNEAYITGAFSDSVVINGVKRFSYGSNDMLIVKLDSALNPLWFQTGGGGNTDGGMNMSTLPSGDVLLLSSYRGLAQFGSVVLTGSPTFAPTFLLTKLSDCGDYNVPLFFSGDTSFCVGGNVRIFTQAQGSESFQWMKDSIVLAGEVFRDILATQGGNYQIIVNGSGCIDTSRSVLVSVGTPPNVSLASLDSVCLGDTAVQLTGGLPLGGHYSGLGVYSDSIFNASLAGIGNTQITYTFSNDGCADSVTQNIFVEPSPTVFFAPINDICLNSGPQVLTNAFPPGGTFSGNGVNGGVFYPDSAGVGTHQITYVFTSASGCSNFDNQPITVDSPDPIAFDSIAPVCQLDSAMILDQGTPVGGTYFGPGVNGDQFNPQGLVAGIYTLGYIVDNQCGVDTIFRDVEVQASPSVSLSSYPDICLDNGLLSLGGGNPSGGIYSGNGVSGSDFDPTVAGVGSSTVYYEFTSVNGCSSIDSSTITVNPLPSITIIQDTAVCDGDSIQLFADGGLNYNWSNGMNGSLITVLPSAFTSYTVTVTDSNSCSDIASVDVDVFANPLVSISGSDSICFGQSASLLAMGADSYFWSTGSLSDTTNVSPDSTTTYTVTGIDLNGCESDASWEVAVNPLPIVQLPSLGELCEDNGPISLSGGLPLGGTYSGPGVTAGIFDPAVAGIGSTDIVYSYTDSQGCQDSTTSNIVVNALPVAQASSDAAICIGDTIALSATGGNSYNWSNGMSGASILVDPSISTTYLVTVTDSNSCSDIDSVRITVNALPVINVSHPASICFGDTALAMASGALSYSWSTGQFGDSTLLSPSVSSSYTVTGTDLNGCSNSSAFSINVNALPNVVFSPLAAICEDASAFTLSSATPSGGIYSGPGVSTGSFDPALTGSGSWSITYRYIDANGCINSDTATQVVNTLPVITLSSDTSICFGESLTLNATGGIAYSWSNGMSGSSITVTPSTSTQYSVTVVDANSCSDSDTMDVVVNANPIVSITGTDTICAGNSTVLNASGAQNYLWSNSDTTQSTSVAPLSTSSFTVTGMDMNGCTDSATFTVNVNAAPNVSLGSLPSICIDNAPINLSGGLPAGGSYSGLGVSMGAFDPQIAGAGTTTIFYAWADSIGCSGLDSSSITVNTLPTVSVTPDSSSVCVGDSVSINAAGANTYTWNNGLSGSTISLLPNSDSTIIVVGTDLNMCSNSDTAFIELLDFPVLTVSPDTFICRGSSVLLTAFSSTGNYAWSTGSSNDSVLVTVNGPTTVTVTSSTNNQCFVTDTINLSALALPIVDLGIDSMILNNCSDSFYVFNAGPGYNSYLWQNQSMDTSYQANFFPGLVGTTEYIWIRVSDSNNCFGYDSVLISYEVCTNIKDGLSTGFDIGLYPNPNTGVFTLSVSDIPGKKAQIKVYDQLGKQMYSVELDGFAQNIEQDFDLQFLPSGVYQLQITSGKEQKILPFIRK